MKKVKIIVALLAVFFSYSAYAQDGEFITVRDFETWTSINLKYKVNKNWRLGLEQQLRLQDNSSVLDVSFTEFSTDYDFNDNVFGGIGIRYIRQNDTEGNIQGLENHLRLQFDLGYKYEINRLDIETRLRYQAKNQLGITLEQGDAWNNHLRFKIGFNYNIKKWKIDPELSTEVFRHYESGEQNGFDKFRFTVGTKYKIKGFGKIGAFYRMEKELNVSYPQTTHIAGLKYTYTIKNNFKSKANKKDKDKTIYY